ncbi:unnamed protein product [Penicillium salamii]|uniref:Zn(2)-C6 fungal-type domain-containing protein n=1 Tax=Penicillium salamii TaxID=1612424 RepID=A0A9W4NUP4_9EURO|nr:unnamed protein product [Penicillium salamii]CAG8282165.1 unnamed protein product [Penicillium salamii]CAG8300251.1 unnamed protein product [Penicillium salamii]CAG8387587.1 unnamed protein product [Penicillium salamii]CAG8407345.1 unnamed protein product [Penicillium salamii]
MTPPASKRACDQCHNSKEKCRRPNTTMTCERCRRLRQTCQTVRNLAKAGRKPRATITLLHKLPASSLSPRAESLEASHPFKTKDTPYSHLYIPFDTGLGMNPALFPELDQWERHFLNLMKDIVAPSPLDKYLIGPSFHESHHRSFVQSMLQPAPALKNATVACAAVLFGDKYAEYTLTSVEVGHRRAALALSELRALKISEEQDLVTALVLGVSMVTFAMHVVDGQPFLISHYTLSLVRPVYQSALRMDPSIMDYLMCLVSTETFECLLTAQTPTLRINEHDRPNVVDRYLGIASSLFAHLYDICAVSSLLRTAGGTMTAQTAQKVEDIRESLEQWKTSPPLNFLERFTVAETTIMLAQAKVLRVAAFLIIHRLYHPFGTHNSAALSLSKLIDMEFDRVLHLTGHSLPCMSFAYLTACFEINGREARTSAIEKSQRVANFSKQSQRRFQQTLLSMWAAKDAGSQIYWFSLNDILNRKSSTWI